MTTVSLSAGVVARYQIAQPLQAGVETRYTETDRLSALVAARATEALHRSVGVEMGFTEAIRMGADLRNVFDEADQLSARTVSHRFQDGLRDRRQALEGRMQEARQLVASTVSLTFQDGLRDRRLTLTAAFEEAVVVRQGRAISSKDGLRSGNLRAGRFQEAWAVRAGVSPPLEPPDPVDPTDPPAATTVVPTRRAYMTINSIELRRVDGNIQLPAQVFSMSLDYQSWTYRFSATLPSHLLSDVMPGNDGDPVEIEAKINGVPYMLSVLEYGGDDAFGKSTITLNGSGLAGILDSPYAPVSNFSNSADRTAQQIVTDVLTVNGVGFGWSVEWGLTDWFVPAGAWMHQGTYISAINAIAAAAGGYVQPHPTQKVLRILPLYPQAPWDWSTVTPDIELPEAVVEVQNRKWVNKAAYNRVFVSGQGKGVLGRGTRAGTAGDLVAPMVTDSLITHLDAARQRAMAVLSDTGTQLHPTFGLPVLAESGIIWPGQFLRRTGVSGNLMGIVRGTSITFGFPKLRQSVLVETHLA